jgi:hypothetical protein
MEHSICRVTGFEITGPYTLRIAFDDGVVREINFEPVLEGPMYGMLRDEELFKQVRIDAEVHTLVWPNGADFDPETLYNWPKYADEMKANGRALGHHDGKGRVIAQNSRNMSAFRLYGCVVWNACSRSWR